MNFIPKNQEYLEGEEPEYAIEQLNRIELNKVSSNYQTSVLLTQSQFQKSKFPDIEDKYENIIKKYEDTFSSIKEENYNEEYDKKFLVQKEEEDFLKTYNDLKAQVELIEKDLNFYKENKEQYKSIVPLENSFEELNKLKYIISYIESSTNFEKLQKINEIKKNLIFK